MEGTEQLITKLSQTLNMTRDTITANLARGAVFVLITCILPGQAFGIAISRGDNAEQPFVCSPLPSDDKIVQIYAPQLTISGSGASLMIEPPQQ